jgi:DNA-binding NtrC family response regulator
MFEYALRIGGFDVSSAGDGLTALRAIDQHFIPDVIVLDLDLPQVSGMDVHQEVAAHADTRAIPIIVVTGTSWHPPQGVFRTLRKPINSDILVRVVQRALEHQQEQSGASNSHNHGSDE